MVLRRVARPLIERLRAYRLARWQQGRPQRVHLRQEREAVAAYRELTTHGRAPLSPALDTRVRDYCAEVLGSPAYQPWMRVYAAYQQRFVEGWIPDDFFELRVLPALQSPYAPLHRKRTLARRVFQTDLFPDLAYHVNGRWFTAGYEPVDLPGLERLAFAEDEEVYVKAESSLEGKGVRRVRRDDFAAVLQSFGKEDLVIQRPVRQHDWYASLNPAAVTTLRVTTSFTAGAAPKFRAAYLRASYGGRGHVQSDKQLRCSIVDSTGRLAPEALDEAWRPHERHPDSGFVYDGATVPHFADAVSTCLELHGRLPHDQIIGWDVVIADTGRPALLEWNNRHPDIKFSEATVGPVFADCRFEQFR